MGLLLWGVYCVGDLVRMGHGDAPESIGGSKLDGYSLDVGFVARLCSG